MDSIHPFHVLLVEDDDGHAMLITQALRKHCGESLCLWRARNGNEAMDRLQGLGPEGAQPMPRVVLLDLKLPGKTGLEVLAAVKTSASLRHIPVVILTTSDASKDRQRAYAAHANGYLVKPTDFDAFCELARSVCSFWGRWNTPLE